MVCEEVAGTPVDFQGAVSRNAVKEPVEKRPTSRDQRERLKAILSDRPATSGRGGYTLFNKFLGPMEQVWPGIRFCFRACL